MRQALVRVPGYREMETEFDRQEVRGVYDPKKTNPEQLAAAIRKGTDFKVTLPGSS